MTSYKNLVLEGGGVLGIAYVGAIEELATRGILDGITNYAGASAGAIMAGLLACNASPAFLRDEYMKTDLAAIMKIPINVVTLFNVYMYYGANTGDAFCQWYGELIHNLTGNREITLGEILATGHDIRIAVVNISQQRVEMLNGVDDPLLPLVKAVRMSAGYPGVLTPTEHNGSLYIDGGFLNNYPIDAFGITDETLGLLLVTSGESVYTPITGVTSYIGAIISCGLNSPQKKHVEDSMWAATIKIVVGDYSSTDFNLDNNDLTHILNNGRKCTAAYFD
tara:strand:+ start:23459 stop:24295 length:837 start_codon:yes stop_codon:yes gene_type:complete